MRAIAPTPARTQSCLARIVAVARCCGAMQAREVASLVARSSSSACSRIALILRLCQAIRVLRPARGSSALSGVRRDISRPEANVRYYRRGARLGNTAEGIAIRTGKLLHLGSGGATDALAA